MPTLADAVHVLDSYQGRYEFLDAFVDDIYEIANQQFGPGARMIPAALPTLETWAEGHRLTIELFEDQGIARMRLMEGGKPSSSLENTGIGAALGGAIGAALGAASAKKEGLLGGLALGILVGGLLGSEATPVERALALQFDPNESAWKLYDGPLLTWAKRTLLPSASNVTSTVGQA